jgi:hypothetical protein
MSQSIIAAIITALLLAANRLWFDGRPWAFVFACVGFVTVLALLHRLFAGTWHPSQKSRSSR